ncbi:MAG: hypothetical protein HRU34_23840 [Richelia sp.]|nr:hypothetical protein [Richelia sp.]
MGVDKVAPVDLDTAWLQVTLKRNEIGGRSFPRRVAGANNKYSQQLATLATSSKPSSNLEKRQPRVDKITDTNSKKK